MADKTPAQKLFMKENSRVLFVHPPQDVRSLLGGLPAGVRVVDRADGPVDFILLFADSRAVLEADLPALRGLMGTAGILWAAYHKGTSKIKTDINRDSIAAFAMTAGLQAVSNIAINEDWSAVRVKKI